MSLNHKILSDFYIVKEYCRNLHWFNILDLNDTSQLMIEVYKVYGKYL